MTKFDNLYKQVLKEYFNEHDTVKLADYIRNIQGRKPIDSNDRPVGRTELQGIPIALVNDRRQVVSSDVTKEMDKYGDLEVKGYGRMAWVINNPSMKGWYVQLKKN
jgi:hypothetical protein